MRWNRMPSCAVRCLTSGAGGSACLQLTMSMCSYMPCHAMPCCTVLHRTTQCMRLCTCARATCACALCVHACHACACACVRMHARVCTCTCGRACVRVGGHASMHTCMGGVQAWSAVEKNDCDGFAAPAARSRPSVSGGVVKALAARDISWTLRPASYRHPARLQCIQP